MKFILNPFTKSEREIFVHILYFLVKETLFLGFFAPESIINIGGSLVRNPLIILVIAAVSIVTITYVIGGVNLLEAGFKVTIRTLLQASVLIFAAFLVVGQLQQMISSDMIEQVLQKYKGAKGIFFASIAGGFFPGPPYVFYPFLSSFKEKKIPFSLFFTFIVGKQVYDFNRIPMEVSLITPGIALLRNIITAPFPLLMGLIIRYFYPRVMIDAFFDSYEDYKGKDES